MDKEELEAQPRPRKDFKWDVSISLCQQDVSFARKLVAEMNHKLKVFFYEDRQAELISKLGPEEFARTFLKDARVVVILHRKVWGKSYYTSLERDAIVERTVTGIDFIFMIPLDKGSKPPWYPASRIYASPDRFSVEELTKFTEFKITGQGGEVTPLTLKEKIEVFKQREERHRLMIKHLQNTESHEILEKVLSHTQNLVNENIQAFEDFPILPGGLKKRPFPENQIGIYNIERKISAEIKVNDLYCVQFKLRTSRETNQKNTALGIELGISRQVSEGQPGRQKVWTSDDVTWYAPNEDGKKLGWSEKMYTESLSPWAPQDHYITDFNGTYRIGPVQTPEELINRHLYWIADNIENAYKKIFG